METMLSKDVLIVDDEQSIRDILSAALAHLGYTPITANDGEQALEILAQRSVLVMIVDMNMPGMNGLELGRRIRAAYPLAQMLALTGYRSLFQLSACREAGFEDYFTKPVKLPELGQALADAFGRLERWRKY
jgi:CheY-like chemotaxis protein